MKKIEEGLKPITFRLPTSYVEKLEKAKWELRTSKVGVLKKALDDLFKKHKV